MNKRRFYGGVCKKIKVCRVCEIWIWIAGIEREKEPYGFVKKEEKWEERLYKEKGSGTVGREKRTEDALIKWHVAQITFIYYI